MRESSGIYALPTPPHDPRRARFDALVREAFGLLDEMAEEAAAAVIPAGRIAVASALETARVNLDDVASLVGRLARTEAV